MKKVFLLLAPFIYCAATAQVTESAIGTSANAFVHAGGSRTNLWYDKNLNTVALIHRSSCNINGAKGTGSVMYDYSTDDGRSWPANQINRGPVYKDITATNCVNGTNRGRYPQGVIYNPPGNTNPANAYVTCYGPVTNDVDWFAHYEGTTQLGSTTNAQNIFPFSNSFNAGLPDCMHIVKNTGIVWAVTSERNDFNLTNVNDTIFLSKGVFNGSDFSYTFKSLYIPNCSNSIPGYIDMSTAWSDDGQIGYVAILGNDWICHGGPNDSIYGLIIYKTTDGGNNWTKCEINNLDFLDPLIANCGCRYTAGFDIDAAVDYQGNLHAFFPVGIYAGFGMIAPAPSTWALVDIVTDCNTTCGNVIAKPGTFRTDYGDGSFQNPYIGEDSRQQLSISWDGTNIFYTWFDIDSIRHPTSYTTLDMYSRGHDLVNDLWTPQVNFTGGTGLFADGHSLFGCVSYYVIDSAANYCIPMAFSYADTINTGSPVQHYYVSGACFNNFNIPSTSLCLPVSVTENNSSNNGIAIYPNPLTTSSTLQLNSSVKDAEVVICDILGKEIMRKKLTGDRMEIERGSMGSGVYVVRVTGGDKQWVEKMVVK